MLRSPCLPWDVLQKVVYTFTPIGLAVGALGLAWMVLVP